MARLAPFLAFTWLLLLTAGVGEGRAQSPEAGQVTGILQDSTTALPVPFATVAVFSQPANTLATSATGDEQGHFVLPGLAPGAYRRWCRPSAPRRANACSRWQQPVSTWARCAYARRRSNYKK